MIVDAAIVAFTGFFTWRGWRRGLLAAFTKLAGFILATIAAVFGYRIVGAPLETLGFSEGVANISGALAIFIGVTAVAWFGARALTRFLDWTKLGLLNHAGGAALAATWSLALVAVVLLAISVAPAGAVKAHVDGSTLARGIVKSAPAFVTTAANSDLRKLITSFLDEPQRKIAATFDFRESPFAVRDLFDAVNAERKRRGLPTLRWDDRLAGLARTHAADMYARGYFGHETPEGLTPGDRLRHARVPFKVTGENLALALTVEQAHAELMRSSRHRTHILARSFTRVGIGVMYGRHGYVIAQEFTG